nr:proteasome subunit beta type-3-like [Rhipicephalus microplus]
MSIMSYNGGVVVPMKGKECVVIAADRHLGPRGHTIVLDFERIFEMGPKVYCGLLGLATDTKTVAQRLKFHINLYELREGRSVTPKTLGLVISNLLYERHFGPYFLQPIVAGLDPVINEPYICVMDLIGCINEPTDFVVLGTCQEQCYGMCETLWEPDMGPDELFEATAQALMNASDRGSASGWGGVVHIIEKDKVNTKYLKIRMD